MQDAAVNTPLAEPETTPTPLLDHVEQAPEVNPLELNYRQELRTRKVPFWPVAENGTKVNNRIPTCGHKLVFGHEPRHRNCESCWFTFFQVHGEVTKAADEVHTQFGLSGLIQLKGRKFSKNFTKFMSTLAQWRKAVEEAAAQQKEANVTSEESTGGAASPDGANSPDGSIEAGHPDHA